MAEYTEAEIVALKKAIASGVLTVRHGETLTTFRSLAEMQEILAQMEAEVSGTSRRRILYAYQSSKGL